MNSIKQNRIVCFYILITVFIMPMMTGCGGKKIQELEKKNASLESQILLLKAKNGTLEAEKNKLEEALKEKENKIVSLEQSENEVKSELEKRGSEIQNLKNLDPNVFWNSEIAPLVKLDDCRLILDKAPTYFDTFKNGPHKVELKALQTTCERKLKIEEVLLKGEFKKALSLAQSEKEKKWILSEEKLREKHGEIAQLAEQPIAENLYAYLTEDVVKAYKLEKEYDTPLKIKSYKQTRDYQKKLEYLKSIKNKIKGHRYEMEIKEAFLKPFNVKEMSFVIPIGKQIGFKNEEAKAPYTYQGFNFPLLEYFQTPSKFGENRPDDQFLKIPVYEELAQKIEKRKDDFKLFVSFKIDEASELPFKFYNNTQGENGGLYDLKAPVVVSKDATYIIRNIKTKRTYKNVDFNENK